MTTDSLKQRIAELEKKLSKTEGMLENIQYVTGVLYAHPEQDGTVKVFLNGNYAYPLDLARTMSQNIFPFGELDMSRLKFYYAKGEDETPSTEKLVTIDSSLE